MVAAGVAACVAGPVSPRARASGESGSSRYVDTGGGVICQPHTPTTGELNPSSGTCWSLPSGTTSVTLAVKDDVLSDVHRQLFYGFGKSGAGGAPTDTGSLCGGGTVTVPQGVDIDYIFVEVEGGDALGSCFSPPPTTGVITAEFD